MNINSDTAKGRGFRTSIQALAGIFAGLILAVWQVDGVPQVVYAYVTSNLGGALLLVGLPAGLTGVISWLWNLSRKDVPNG